MIKDTEMSGRIGKNDIYHVSSEINAKDCDCSQGQGDVAKDEGEEGRDFGNVGGEGVGNGLFQVVEDQSALFHSRYDGGKVVIKQNHISGLQTNKYHINIFI